MRNAQVNQNALDMAHVGTLDVSAPLVTKVPIVAPVAVQKIAVEMVFVMMLTEHALVTMVLLAQAAVSWIKLSAQIIVPTQRMVHVMKLRKANRHVFVTLVGAAKIAV